MDTDTLADSIETVLKLSEGIVVVRTEDGQVLPSAKTLPA